MNARTDAMNLPAHYCIPVYRIKRIIVGEGKGEENHRKTVTREIIIGKIVKIYVIYKYCMWICVTVCVTLFINGK